MNHALSPTLSSIILQVGLRHLMAEIDVLNSPDTHAAELARNLTIVDSTYTEKCMESRASFIKDINNDVVEEWADTTDTATQLAASITAKEFTAYVAVDNDLPLSADLIDADIFADVQKRSKHSDESDPKSDITIPIYANEHSKLPLVTFFEVIECLKKIYSYLLASCYDYYRVLRSVRSGLRSK
ncbi:hypothetical protein RF11_08283 [Thelohanellus kitauei]|uniref:Uncharacterized protein n=1 Tax=Thelohanellus kitauei TaxID=669202 RepID=A0A0C2JFA3_THEKT|nr:hypothetical protein RF11_08283 [Thelohanellus kitauei]